MTYTAFLPADFADRSPLRRSRRPSSEVFVCALALVLSASAGVAFLYAPLRDDAKTAEVVVAPPPPAHPARVAAAPATRTQPTAAPVAPANYSGLFDPNWTGGLQPLPWGRLAPLRAAAAPRQTADTKVAEAEVAPAPAAVAPPVAIAPPAQAVVPLARVIPAPQLAPALGEAVPMPAPRPVLVPPEDTPPPALPGTRRAARTPAAPRVPAPVTTAQPAQPSFFQKLFGMIERPQSALAYAAPDFSGLGGIDARRSGLQDGQTAIYDIAAHTVYLPNGTRLEAHSGLGAAHDNPRSVAEHMRGVTPPNLYDLTPREALFHGVRALRLTPVGNGTTYGRAGLLAHTYMLGPRGDSNGCVVFRNYEAFLQAYESGAIRRLAVVARLN